ncbi:MAG: A/G-specific adenine glycosylase [Armatimonadetes bacterium]|nr:A/G-specific adenine glycosylase [Armatimonadota bacterium]
MTDVQRRLLDWYEASRRDLPWRRTADPYAVWVSEAMLQQTTVKAVVPYFERWMKRFPTVEDLARAEADECASYWAGLGYYARCRRLQDGAKWIVEHGFPSSADAWLDVPGVGPYTAGAIASIALGEPAALVDGNVERVYSRLNDDAASGPALHRAAWAWAKGQVCQERPSDWNQALMELGATVCKPRSPSCTACPLHGLCRAVASGTVDFRPVRPPRKAPVELDHHVWVPRYKGRLGIVQTPPGEWWAGLWGFPRSASTEALDVLVGPSRRRPIGHFRHTVTGHRIDVEVSVADCERPSSSLTWCEPADVRRYALPAPQERALSIWERAVEDGSGTDVRATQVSLPTNA